MKTHDTFLELAAAAVDFGLSSAERSRLDAHLAECPLCVRSAAGLRADALGLTELPRVVLPERRADAILYAAMHPAAVRHPVRLVAIAALLTLLLLGSLAVGAELLRRLDDEDRLVVVPVPTESAAPSPSPSGEPAPSGQPGSGLIAGPSTGTLVVTHADAAGDRVVELLDLDGLAVTNLTPALGWDPAWLSPTELLYSCPGMDTEQPGICLVRVDSPDAGRLLLSDADRAAPAPDGRSVAVHRGTTDVGTTWLMNPDGSNPRELATGWFPRWRPDGGWLMGQPESAAYTVAIVGVGGEGLITVEPGYDPAWSPDGEHIAYVLVDGDGRASLRDKVLGADPATVLYTAPAGSELAAPAWLPGGAIVFVQDGDLWRLDAEAINPVELTAGLQVIADPLEQALDVSPDGQWVAFTSGAADAGRLGIASVHGGWTLIDLPGGRGGAVTQARWQPGTVTSSPSGPASTTGPGPGTGSPVGTTWAPATVPAAGDRPSGTIHAVTDGGPGFVAVGMGCIGDAPECEAVVWTSVDGRTWERVPASPATDLQPYFATSGPAIGMFDVAAGAPGLVAIGYAAAPDLETSAWFSRDGVSWERTALGNTMLRVNAVTWDGRQFVAVGEDRSLGTDVAKLATATARAAVWTSADGRTWTRVPHTAALDAGGFIDTMEDPITGGMRDVVVGPDGLLAVGSVCEHEPAACQPAAWTSRDGVAWSRVTDLTIGDQGVLKAVASSGSGYVAVGQRYCGDTPSIEAGDCPALVLTSPDGLAWTERPFAQSGDLRSIAVVGNRLFATAPDGPVTMWTSADGTTWSPAEVQGGPGIAEGGGLVREWHLAATPDTAVWLGSAGEGGEPGAWVSGAP